MTQVFDAESPNAGVEYSVMFLVCSTRTLRMLLRGYASFGCVLLGLLLAPLWAAAQGGDGAPGPVIPLFTPAGDVQEGFARVINHSNRSGTVRIHGSDDTGSSYGPVTLSLDANQTRHFNSGDLEEGNAEKGLSGGLGDGEGNWRLRLQSDLELEVGAYIHIRTADGFLSSVHDVVGRAEVGAMRCITCRYSTPGATAIR